ncbi:MAG: branched-chain amino acid ABC transporter permease [Rhodospirillaceae bacterium]|nr:branched-chain amino acid ABC transporter permease [Rhodospirillaceae bacterium]
MIGGYEVSLITVIGINVILALSLNLITGFCGQISLGHAAFFGTGAYATAVLTVTGTPLAPALIAGIVSAGILGLVVGLASLRVRHDFLAITTMGVGFLFLGFVRKQEWLGGELGISRIPPVGVGDIGYMLIVVALSALAVAFSLYVKKAWIGFAFDAVADDEDAAQTVGVDVSRYKLTAFALGTAIAGLAGGLYAQFTRFIIPDAFNFITSITVLAMVVVGGIGSTWGVLAAAVVLTLMPELFRFVNDYKLLIYGGLILAVMRFSPGGLAGIVRGAVKWVAVR